MEKKMMFKNKIFKILVNEEDKYALIQWLSPTLHMEFVDGMTTIYKIIAESQFTKLISDVRLLGILDEKSIRFTNEVMIPSMQHLHKIAIVLPEGACGSTPNDEWDSSLTINVRNIQKSYRAFKNLEEAESWMK